MQVGWAVQRRGQIDVFLATELDDVIVEQCQIRRYDERELLPVYLVHPFRLGHDPADQREVEQRLATLKLELQMR